MGKRGWNLSALQRPASVHMCVTAKHAGTGPKFVTDLRESIDEVKNNPEMYKHSTAAVSAFSYFRQTPQFSSILLSPLLSFLLFLSETPISISDSKFLSFHLFVDNLKMYGLAASLPDRTLVNDLIVGVLDAILDP